MLGDQGFRRRISLPGLPATAEGALDGFRLMRKTVLLHQAWPRLSCAPVGTHPVLWGESGSETEPAALMLPGAAPHGPPNRPEQVPTALSTHRAVRLPDVQTHVSRFGADLIQHPSQFGPCD